MLAGDQRLRVLILFIKVLAIAIDGLEGVAWMQRGAAGAPIVSD